MDPEGLQAPLPASLQIALVLKGCSFCLCCNLRYVRCGWLFVAVWHQAKLTMENGTSCSQHRTKKASLVIRFLPAVWLPTRSSGAVCSALAGDRMSGGMGQSYHARSLKVCVGC